MTSHDKLTPKQYMALSRFIQDNYGIKLNPSKILMVESRIRKRMKETEFCTFNSYLDYVFNPTGLCREMMHMIDAVTTNKTQFFREPEHFDILVREVIPTITSEKFKKFNIWSAACSTGEEPYTLAMVMDDAARRSGNLKYSILASDLSTKVLKAAYEGVYHDDLAQDIPPHFRKKYVLKSKDKSLGLIRIDDSIRKHVTFRRINLMSGDFGIKDKIHVIFCRNVLIYFSKDRQEQLMQRFYNLLEPGGYLFIGHSESIIGMNVPFYPLAPTVYRK